MPASRNTWVEHFVEDQKLCPVTHENGPEFLEIPFHPSPGPARAFVVVDPAPPVRSLRGGVAPGRAARGAPVLTTTGSTATTGAPRPVFMRKPALPRPTHPRIDTRPDVILEDPPLPPLPPRRFPLRIEVGPEEGPFQAFDTDRSAGSTPFMVGGGSTPTPDGTEEGMVVMDEVLIDRFNRTVRPPRWVCRIRNVGTEDVSVRARVFFTVRRQVRVTSIPRERFTTIFEGALRWLTPIIGVNHGDLVVGLAEPADEVVGIDPVRVDLEAADLTDVDIEMTPVTFEVISAARFFRDAFEDFVRRFERNISGISVLNLAVPDSFVDDMVESALRGDRSDLTERAADLLGLPPDLGLPIVRGIFDDLEIPRTTPPVPFGFRPLDDDLAMRVTLTVTKVHAAGTTAIGTADVMLESIVARLYVLIGTSTSFREHPLSQMPNHPRHEQYENEWTATTSTTFTTRFVIEVGDFELEVEGDTLAEEAVAETVLFLGDTLDKLPDEEDLEDIVEGTVRGFLEDHRAELNAATLTVVMNIAERSHVLHDVRLDAGNLVIEHFDPISDPKFPFPGPPRRELGDPIDGPMPATADDRLASIDHIVVVTMENRSFDHMLGFLSHPDATVQPAGPRTDVDGLTGNELIPLGPGDPGAPVPPRPGTNAEFHPDPGHGFFAVREQIGDGAMDGFISSFRQRLLESQEINARVAPLNDERRIVGFQLASAVPTFEYVAEEFGVLDRYFAAFPGGTQPNRVCILTGDTPVLTNAEFTPNLGYLDDRTLFDVLDQERVPWRYYEGDIGFLRVFDAYRVDFERLRPLDEFLQGGDAPLHPVTFIDPNFKETPSEEVSNDDHAPTPVSRGQALLCQILERLRASESWDRTLLIITYDEHGGFYDHVPPPGTAPFGLQNPGIDNDIPRVHPDATSYGVRVPALVVSPLIERGAVGHAIYDHTTITRTILQRFAPERVGTMPERVRRARHFGELLGTEIRTSIPRSPCADTAGQPGSPLRMSTPESPVLFERVRIDPEDERVQIQMLGVPTEVPTP